MVSAHMAHQGADITVFRRPLGPRGDLDCLFAIGGHAGVVVAVLRGMDDPEIDLRPGPPGAGSHTVTFWGPPLMT